MTLHFSPVLPTPDTGTAPELHDERRRRIVQGIAFVTVWMALGYVLGLPEDMYLYLLLYYPVLFILEEVTFRGMLDSQLHHDSEGRGWGSALLVSALWGLWHLPMNPDTSLLPAVVMVLAIHCLIGVPLSFAWRRTHNLAGLALAHAAIDSVRNGLLAGL